MATTRTAPRRGAAAGAGAVSLVPYALAGGVAALRPVADTSNRMSRASIWQLLRSGGPEHLLGIRDAQRVGAVIGSVGPGALILVVAMGVLFSLSR